MRRGTIKLKTSANAFADIETLYECPLLAIRNVNLFQLQLKLYKKILLKVSLEKLGILALRAGICGHKRCFLAFRHCF